MDRTQKLLSRDSCLKRPTAKSISTTQKEEILKILLFEPSKVKAHFRVEGITGIKRQKELLHDKKKKKKKKSVEKSTLEKTCPVRFSD